MAKYWLLNSVSSGRRSHFAGDSLDDTAVDSPSIIAAIQSAGGVLVLQGNADLDNAAARVAARRRGRGISDVDASGIMMAAADGSAKKFVDQGRFDPNAALVAMTDADQTVLLSDGAFRRITVALTANRTKTLSPTGAVAGDQIEFARISTDAFTVAFVNGGPGAGTLATMPVSKQGSLKFQFNGTDWIYRSGGTI